VDFSPRERTLEGLWPNNHSLKKETQLVNSGGLHRTDTLHSRGL
jgi:hypothetical protein